MTRSLRPAGAALVAVLALLGTLLVPAPAQADTVDLAVSITSPADGSFASGDVAVGVLASTSNAGTDVPATITLLADGVPVGSPVACGGGNSCSGTVTWSTTGLVGDRFLTAVVTTAEGASPLTSAAVIVGVNRPSVAITSPADGSNQTGLLSIDVTASTPASAPDDPDTIELLVDDVLQPGATQTCAGSSHSCLRTLQYDATGAAGSLKLTARLRTTFPQTTTDVVTVTVSTPAPTVSITSPTGGTVTGPVSVSVRATTDGTLTDLPSSVSVVADAGTPSAVSLGSVTCDGVAHVCTGSVQWETSGLTGAHTLDATLLTARGVSQPATTRTLTVDSPLPTTSISDPVGGSTVSGTVVVTASASTDNRLTEVPTQIQLLADGGVVDTQPCVLATHDCSLTLTWDATGLTGDHVLTTVVSTSLLRTATSSAVTVAVTTPPFDVAITSPAASAVVVGPGATTTSSGIVPVAVTASTDLTQNEYPALLELLVDGLVVDQFICDGSPVHACATTLDWDARTSAGLHKLAARVTTTRNHEATSASRSVFARSGSRVAFVATPIDAYGGYITLRGVVTSTTSKQPLVGAAVRLVLVPAIGTARTLVVRTGVGGVFTLRTRYYSNTVVSARVGASWLVKGTALVTQRVRAPISCSTAGTSFVRGTVGRGVCVVRNLPAGTVVRLRYNYRGRWFALATGRTTSTVVRFTFRFLPRGTYSLQVTVGASRPYVATASRLMKIVIR